jgi:hypothetical protein
MASPAPPRLVLSPQRERLWVVDEQGGDVGTLDWCPVCGGELPWSAAGRGASTPPEYRASQHRPVAVVVPGTRFTVRAAGRRATGIVIGIGPQALTCLVALWLGSGREPHASDPDVLTLSPVWPLSTGAWVVDGVETTLAAHFRCRAVVQRPDAMRPDSTSLFRVGPGMELEPTDAWPAAPLVVHEPTELLADVA